MPVYGLRARRLGVEDLVHVERALLAEVLQAFTSLEGALGPESLVLEQWQTTVVEAPKRDEVGRQRDTERLFYCGDGFGARRFAEATDRTGNVLLHPLHDPRNRGADPVILRRCGPLRRRLLHDRHVFLGGRALFGGGGLSWRGALFGGGLLGAALIVAVVAFFGAVRFFAALVGAAGFASWGCEGFRKVAILERHQQPPRVGRRGVF